MLNTWSRIWPTRIVQALQGIADALPGHAMRLIDDGPQARADLEQAIEQILVLVGSSAATAAWRSNQNSAQINPFRRTMRGAPMRDEPCPPPCQRASAGEAVDLVRRGDAVSG